MCLVTLFLLPVVTCCQLKKEHPDKTGISCLHGWSPDGCLVCEPNEVITKTMILPRRSSVFQSRSLPKGVFERPGVR